MLSGGALWRGKWKGRILVFPVRKVLSSLAGATVPSGAAVYRMTLVFGGGGAWGIVINPNLQVIVTMISPD